MPDDLHLDHVGIVVADLDAAARSFDALGFRQAARSFHTSSGPGGAEERSGTANQCAMLEQGYLELITVVDPGADSFNRHQISGFLDAYEGLHIVALGIGDAERKRAELLRAGVATSPIRELRRHVDGPSGGGEAWFRLLMPNGLETEDAVTFFIEHRTRDLVWSSGPNRHRNGARALNELTIVVPNPAEAARLYAPALDREPSAGPNGLRFELSRSALVLADHEQAAFTFGREVQPWSGTLVAGVVVEVEDLDAATALLIRENVPFDVVGGRPTVGPKHACGAFLQFTGQA